MPDDVTDDASRHGLDSDPERGQAGKKPSSEIALEVSEAQLAALLSAATGSSPPGRPDATLGDDDQRSGHSSVACIDCHVPLNVGRLETALQAVAAVHPALTSVFAITLSGPVLQIPASAGPSSPPAEGGDASRTPPTMALSIDSAPAASSKAGALRQALQDTYVHAFDPSRQPLVEVAVRPLSPTGFRLSIVSHPSVLDRSAFTTLVSDVLRHYRMGPAALHGAPVPSRPASPTKIEVPGREAGDQLGEKDCLGTDGSRSNVTPVARLDPAAEAAFAVGAPVPPEHWITDHTPRPAATHTETGVSDENIEHAVEQVVLPEILVRRLNQCAAAVGGSLDELLLVAHVKAVCLATGQRSVAVGLETNPSTSTSTSASGPSLAAPSLPSSEVLSTSGQQQRADHHTQTAAIRLGVEPGTWQGLVENVRACAMNATKPHAASPERISKDLGLTRLLDSTFTYSRDCVEAHLLDAPSTELDKEVGIDLAAGLGRLAGHSQPALDASASLIPFSGAVLAQFIHSPTSGALALRLVAGRRLTSQQLREVLRLHVSALEGCANPGGRHSDLAALAPHQQDRVLVDWQGPARPYRQDRTVHELFEAQAAKTPSAVAVEGRSGTLTFQQLNDQADALARHLRSSAVGTGQVVGVCLGRDTGLLVAFLGILKSGAAYLPLDPDHPPERMAFMLDDCDARFVISDCPYTTSLPEGPWTVIGSEEYSTDRADRKPSATGRDEDPSGAGSAPTDLMYVIYTSGSTGRPKGVQVPHRGVVNYLAWCVDAYVGDRRGGAPVFSSPAFDMVVPNLYAPLLTGQRVLMIDERLDLIAAAEFLVEAGPFAFIKLTPGQLDMLGSLLSPEQAESLAGILVVGADAFSPSTLGRWRRIDPHTPILNEYGPTEASVANTTHLVDGTETGDLLPIGRPIPNTSVFVLDAAGIPTGIGVPGELFIGGDCVVDGYANRPDETSQRFVNDPFDCRPAQRLYRTGDIVRWLPSGVLEFMGRADHQVKIRGYRVEPAEVEEAIQEHPDVAQAAVATVGQTRQTLSLAGYYVSATGLDPSALRRFLQARVPDYLIPSFLIPVDRIPLTSNGKVDRAALPTPERGPTGSRETTTVEHTIMAAAARAWSTVLGTSALHPGTRFTSADQLLARVHLAAALTAELSVPLTLALCAAHQSTTFGELCDFLARELPTAGAPTISGNSAAEVLDRREDALP